MNLPNKPELSPQSQNVQTLIKAINNQIALTSNPVEKADLQRKLADVTLQSQTINQSQPQPVFTVGNFASYRQWEGQAGKRAEYAKNRADFEANVLPTLPQNLQDLYNSGDINAFNKGIEDFNIKNKASYEANIKNFETNVLPTYPQELQAAYKKGGFEALNKAIEDYNSRNAYGIEPITTVTPPEAPAVTVNPQIAILQGQIKDLQSQIDAGLDPVATQVTQDEIARLQAELAALTPPAPPSTSTPPIPPDVQKQIDDIQNQIDAGIDPIAQMELEKQIDGLLAPYQTVPSVSIPAVTPFPVLKVGSVDPLYNFGNPVPEVGTVDKRTYGDYVWVGDRWLKRDEAKQSGIKPLDEIPDYSNVSLDPSAQIALETQAAQVASYKLQQGGRDTSTANGITKITLTDTESLSIDPSYTLVKMANDGKDIRDLLQYYNDNPDTQWNEKALQVINQINSQVKAYADMEGMEKFQAGILLGIYKPVDAPIYKNSKLTGVLPYDTIKNLPDKYLQTLSKSGFDAMNLEIKTDNEAIMAKNIANTLIVNKMWDKGYGNPKEGFNFAKAIIDGVITKEEAVKLYGKDNVDEGLANYDKYLRYTQAEAKLSNYLLDTDVNLQNLKDFGLSDDQIQQVVKSYGNYDLMKAWQDGVANEQILKDLGLSDESIARIVAMVDARKTMSVYTKDGVNYDIWQAYIDGVATAKTLKDFGLSDEQVASIIDEVNYIGLSQGAGAVTALTTEAQKQIKQVMVQLGDGQWMNKEAFDALDPVWQGVGLNQGLYYMQGMIEADYVSLKNGELVPRQWFDKLDVGLQNIGLTQGYTPMLAEINKQFNDSMEIWRTTSGEFIDKDGNKQVGLVGQPVELQNIFNSNVYMDKDGNPQYDKAIEAYNKAAKELQFKQQQLTLMLIGKDMGAGKYITWTTDDKGNKVAVPNVYNYIKDGNDTSFIEPLVGIAAINYANNQIEVQKSLAQELLPYAMNKDDVARYGDKLDLGDLKLSNGSLIAYLYDNPQSKQRLIDAGFAPNDISYHPMKDGRPSEAIVQTGVNTLTDNANQLRLSVQNIQTQLDNRTLSVTYQQALMNAYEQNGIKLEYDKNTGKYTANGQVLSDDLSLGRLSRPIQIWDTLSKEQKQMVATTLDADKFKGNPFAEFINTTNIASQSNILTQLITSPVSIIGTPIAKATTGQHVSGLEWTEAGAMVAMLAAGGLGGMIGGIAGRLVTLGIELPATGIFIAPTIPTILDPKVAMKDKAVAIGMDVLMLAGLGKGIKGISAPKVEAVKLKAVDLAVDGMKPERADNVLVSNLSKVDKTVQAINRNLDTANLPSKAIVNIQDATLRAWDTTKGLPKDILNAVKSLPSEYELLNYKFNTTLLRIDNLVLDILSHDITPDIKMALIKSVNTIKSGWDTISLKTSVGYIKFNEALDQLMTTIPNKIMSGNYSKPLKMQFKELQRIVGNEYRNTITELKTVRDRAIANVEVQFIKLNEAIDAVMTDFPERLMSGYDQTILKQNLAQLKSDLSVYSNQALQALKELKETTGTKASVSIIKLEEAIDKLMTDIPEKIMSGQYSNDIKMQLQLVLKRYVDKIKFMVDKLPDKYDIALTKLNDSVDGIVNQIPDKVMSGYYKDVVSQELLQLKRGLGKSFTDLQKDLSAKKYIAVNELNIRLNKVNDAIDTIMTDIPEGIMSGKYSKEVGGQLTEYLNSLKIDVNKARTVKDYSAILNDISKSVKDAQNKISMNPMLTKKEIINILNPIQSKINTAKLIIPKDSIESLALKKLGEYLDLMPDDFIKNQDKYKVFTDVNGEIRQAIDDLYNAVVNKDKEALKTVADYLKTMAKKHPEMSSELIKQSKLITDNADIIVQGGKIEVNDKLYDSLNKLLDDTREFSKSDIIAMEADKISLEPTKGLETYKAGELPTKSLLERDLELIAEFRKKTEGLSKQAKEVTLDDIETFLQAKGISLQELKLKLDKIAKDASIDDLQTYLNSKGTSIDDIAKSLDKTAKSATQFDIDTYLKNEIKKQYDGIDAFMNDLKYEGKRYSAEEINKVIDDLRNTKKLSPEEIDLYKQIADDQSALNKVITEGVEGNEAIASELSNRIMANTNKLNELRLKNETTYVNEFNQRINKRLKELGYNDKDIADLTEIQKINIIGDNMPKRDIGGSGKTESEQPPEPSRGGGGGVGVKERTQTKPETKKGVTQPRIETKPTLESVADKIAKGEKLTAEEQQIRVNNAQQVEDILKRKLKEATGGKVDNKQEAKPETKQTDKTGTPSKTSTTTTARPDVPFRVVPEGAGSPIEAWVWESGKLIKKMVQPASISYPTSKTEPISVTELRTDTMSQRVPPTGLPLPSKIPVPFKEPKDKSFGMPVITNTQQPSVRVMGETTVITQPEISGQPLRQTELLQLKLEEPFKQQEPMEQTRQQTVTQFETKPAIKYKTEPFTQTVTKPLDLTQPLTQPEYKTQPQYKELTKTKTLVEDKLRLMVPSSDDTSKVEYADVDVPEGSYSWKQGFVFKLLPPPYKKTDIMTLRLPPVGFLNPEDKGEGVARRTLQIIGKPPKRLPDKVDLGWAWVKLTMKGGKPDIEYLQGEDANTGMNSVRIMKKKQREKEMQEARIRKYMDKIDIPEKEPAFGKAKKKKRPIEKSKDSGIIGIRM
jgi:hypothetical protein